ncbi:MAG: 4-alpha-glucanotransferase, partial [Clostridia bacterium]
MRASGILLHITSLPSKLGVGSLGRETDKFIKFLVKSKQKYWQVLPTTPADFVNSPYASSSAFAGNYLLIDFDALVSAKLLSQEEVDAVSVVIGMDYDYAKKTKSDLLNIAFGRFSSDFMPKDYLNFKQKNAFWLEDYALFMSLKEYFNGKSWLEWPDELARMRDADTLDKYEELLYDRINYYIFEQYIFDRQWKDFRVKLARNGIKLIGDIPMYVAYDSADVWARHELFMLSETRAPYLVAGVPPDYFSEDGQLWGNPIYNWKEMKKQGYGWWKERVMHCAELYDTLRIDHFRAFDSYYVIKYGAKTAKVGVWEKGIGEKFLRELISSVPTLQIIAEDLGDIPASVLQLRDNLGLAGMKIMQFAFDGNKDNAFLPANYTEHCVAYLGTHDNDTTYGWWSKLSDTERIQVADTCGIAVQDDRNTVVHK